MVNNFMDGDDNSGHHHHHLNHGTSFTAIPNGIPGINHHVAPDGSYHHPFTTITPTDTDPHRDYDSASRQRPPPKTVARTRASNACNHCKRRRRKCESDNCRAPCLTCIKMGEQNGCYFYAKGEPNEERNQRYPRVKRERLPAKDSARARRNALRQEDPWADLPPLEEMINGVQQFVRHYFQLGFIPKERYPETLRNNHRSVNVFLLLSILSVSARLSPPLRARYGGGLEASRFFMNRAQRIAEREVYAEPLLERCQAYYVLSMAQQGEGLRHDSHMNMGIAIRMATDMELHVESSYEITNPTPESIIRAESARRTLWMLHSQDKLHSGPRSVESLSASDITTLLPSNEADFAAGREPRIRAALSATPSGTENPELVFHPESSLFASLMEAHLFWGVCMRRGYASYARSTRSHQDGESEIMQRLREWEERLPREHTFSTAMLRQHKAQGQDLAYLGVTMIVRLCNIVLRRPYLEDIIHIHEKPPQEQALYTEIANDLFKNVYALFEQIEAQFTDRNPDENVGAQMAAFCVYSCALFSTYLRKYPGICPDKQISQAGPHMFKRTRSILVECQQTWPLAAGWLDSVDRFSRDQEAVTPFYEGSMADGKDPMPNILGQHHPPSRRLTTSQPRKQESLPPAPPGNTTPAASHDMSASFSSSTYSHPTPNQSHHPTIQEAYLSPPHHPQVPGQHQPPQHQPDPYTSPHYIAPDPNLLHQPPPPPQGIYYTHPSSDSIDSLITNPAQHQHQHQAQHQAQPPPPPPQAHVIPQVPVYDMVDTSGMGGPHGMPFLAADELVPRTDGFDDQLQTFARTGPTEMASSNGWMNGFHGGPLG